MVQTVSAASRMHIWMIGGTTYDKEEQFWREDLMNLSISMLSLTYF